MRIADADDSAVALFQAVLALGDQTNAKLAGAHDLAVCVADHADIRHVVEHGEIVAFDVFPPEVVARITPAGAPRLPASVSFWEDACLRATYIHLCFVLLVERVTQSGHVAPGFIHGGIGSPVGLEQHDSSIPGSERIRVLGDLQQRWHQHIADAVVHQTHVPGIGDHLGAVRCFAHCEANVCAQEPGTPLHQRDQPRLYCGFHTSSILWEQSQTFQTDWERRQVAAAAVCWRAFLPFKGHLLVGCGDAQQHRLETDRRQAFACGARGGHKARRDRRPLRDRHGWRRDRESDRARRVGHAGIGGRELAADAALDAPILGTACGAPLADHGDVFRGGRGRHSAHHHRLGSGHGCDDGQCVGIGAQRDVRDGLAAWRAVFGHHAQHLQQRAAGLHLAQKFEHRGCDVSLGIGAVRHLQRVGAGHGPHTGVRGHVVRGSGVHPVGEPPLVPGLPGAQHLGDASESDAQGTHWHLGAVARWLAPVELWAFETGRARADGVEGGIRQVGVGQAARDSQLDVVASSTSSAGRELHAEEVQHCWCRGLARVEQGEAQGLGHGPNVDGLHLHRAIAHALQHRR